ncbi:MAG: right-handed parallel beta-helix repeat-containing protein [Gammaproteobacteria bacterium]|nr:right-handed parallel beta-helix repeat-containing protein [Gammaproteobacteria bacterium]
MKRFDFFYRQRVTEGELDGAFDAVEDAIHDLNVDVGLTGIVSGGVASESSPAALSVDVTGPLVAYDKTGARIYNLGNETIDCSVDENGVSTAVAGVGNERWLSIFALFDRALSDERTDGLGQTVYFQRAESVQFIVRQGAEATSGAGTKPSLDAEGLLLCDVLLEHGDATILDAAINADRREDLSVFDAGLIGIENSGFTILSGTDVQSVIDDIDTVVFDIDAAYDAHVAGISDRHDGGQIDISDAGFTHLTEVDSQALFEEIDADLYSADAVIDSAFQDILLSGGEPTDGGALVLDVAAAFILHNGIVYDVDADNVALNNNDDQWVYFSGGVYSVNTISPPSSGVPIARVVTSGGAITSIVDMRIPLDRDVQRRTVLVGNKSAAHFSTLSAAFAALDAYRDAGLSTAAFDWDIRVIGVCTEPDASLPIAPANGGWRLSGAAEARIDFSSDTALFAFDGLTDIVVEDLNIRHTAGTAPDGSTRERVVFSLTGACERVRIARIDVTSATDGIHGFLLFPEPETADCLDISVRDVTDDASRDFFIMVESGGDGTPDYDGVKDLLVENCRSVPALAAAGTNPNAAIFIGSGERIRIRDCTFQNWDSAGIWLQKAQDVLIDNCNIESDAECVIVDTGTRSVKVTHCQVVSSGDDGIEIRTSYNIVTENWIASVAAMGIYEQAGDYNLFASNQLNGSSLSTSGINSVSANNVP